MFGIVNRMLTAGAKFGNNVATYFIKEFIFNLTAVDVANTYIISDTSLIPTVSASLIEKTSIVAASITTSSSIRKKVFEIISGAIFICI